MRHLLISVALFLALGCTHTRGSFANVPRLPEIGETFTPPPRAIAVVSGGATRHSYDVAVGGIRYSVMVSSDTYAVVALSTSDPHFRTPEGARIGASALQLRAFEGHWVTEASYCTYVLRSGWEASISTGDPLSPHACPPQGAVTTQFTRHTRTGA